MSDPDKDGAFGTAAINNALKDVVNSQSDAGQTDKPPKPSGWVEKSGYNYAAYNASTREEREAAQSSGATEDGPAWAANAVKYEWSDEYGDVGPAHPELEKQLFQDENIMRIGNDILNIQEIEVTQEGEMRIRPVRKFEDAGLHPIMLQNVSLCRYEAPTPIQAYCLPAILKGQDVIACAQTGSGKTAAFLIPTLSKLMGKAKRLAAPRPNVAAGFDPRTDAVRAEPLILVVAPSRELATQIFDEARRLCYRSMLRPCVVYGGGPVHEQRIELQKGCDVLIATPGRLCDFMEKPHILSLRRVRYTIIDEADEMLNADWDEELKKIMSGGDTNEDADHVYMMFSATFPKGARELARQFMALDHVRIRVGRAGSTHINVQQTVIWVDEDKKKQALYDLLSSMPPARTLIFVNSKRQADFIDDYLYNLDLPSTSIHADRTQREREDAIRAFRSGKCPILVATGVTARGIDIRNVMHVINFDLPSTAYGGIDEYIHRIGRTARIGNRGLATSFFNDRNEDIADVLVKVLLEAKQEIPDFLQGKVPEGGAEAITFDDDTDNEGDDQTATGWGETASAQKTETAPAAADSGWENPEPTKTDAKANDGWGKPEPAKADASEWQSASNDDWQSGAAW
ncbi:DEAD/DEAH box RNA helicase [Xylona heveae TC161]|uniref:RNA helicase n=1 Tax=Xylona heveae (strain CBS 132557 / TC161) TaxID=1328760 RepID=A0A165AH61_XYLHT|nr:DEAD/DEAH box RNA helicase [Xylona heveae TC161]KZF20464.1 DEAD/DEAH box RNA helicase [Xylona heveae TC161]